MQKLSRVEAVFPGAFSNYYCWNHYRPVGLWNPHFIAMLCSLIWFVWTFYWLHLCSVFYIDHLILLWEPWQEHWQEWEKEGSVNQRFHPWAGQDISGKEKSLLFVGGVNELCSCPCLTCRHNHLLGCVSWEITCLIKEKTFFFQHIVFTYSMS